MFNLAKIFQKILKQISKYSVKRYSFNKISKNDKVILIYRIDLIGDYVISKDFLRLVKNCPKFKNYKIVFIGNIILKDFILDFDKEYIDEYITCNFNLLKYSSYKKALIKAINKYKYEYVLNYMSIRNVRSEFITSNINSGKKYGIVGTTTNLKPEEKIKYDKLYDKLYDVTIDYSICGLELLNNITESDCGEYIHQYNYDLNKLKYFEQKYNTPYAIIFPSASYESKRMPFEKFLQLSEYLYEKYGFKIYICGSKSDKEIFKDFDIDKYSYVEDLCGEHKLSELPYLFKNAKIVLTNDTCAMHIAKCAHTKSVVFSNVYEFNVQNLKVIKENKENFYRYQVNKINYVLPDSAYEQMLKNGISQKLLSLDQVNIKNAIYNISEILSE